MPRPFCASLRGRNAHGHVASHKRNLMRKLTGKMPDTPSSTPVLRELAQSKCTWACHKTHFWQKFTGKMPLIPDIISINQHALARTRRTLSVATLFGELYSTDKVEVEGPKSWTFFNPGVWTGKYIYSLYFNIWTIGTTSSSIRFGWGKKRVGT